jgi:hypothetical protein
LLIVVLKAKGIEESTLPESTKSGVKDKDENFKEVVP